MHPIPQGWCEPQQSGQGQQEQAAQVTSPWVLNTSEDVDTTDAPANLFQHFTLFFCLKEMPLVSVHAQCTLTCHWVQLQELILPPNILSLFPYDRLKKKKQWQQLFPQHSLHYRLYHMKWFDYPKSHKLCSYLLLNSYIWTTPAPLSAKELFSIEGLGNTTKKKKKEQRKKLHCNSTEWHGGFLSLSGNFKGTWFYDSMMPSIVWKCVPWHENLFLCMSTSVMNVLLSKTVLATSR